MASFQLHPASYRDRSGFVFYHNGQLYRQVNRSFADAFDLFQRNGLSQHLTEKKILLPYTVLNKNFTNSNEWFLTLQPEVVPFIAYPYEWCFDMLKDAALTTLQAAQEAIRYNMMLKDASAYNLQWYKGRMQFIDTLSFEPYDDKQPWVAYRQFCEQFLAPLALMHYLKEPLQPVQLAYPEGIPLPLAKKMLPFRSRWHLHTYLHLHLQAKFVAKTALVPHQPVQFSKKKMLQLLSSLQQSVSSFSFNTASGIWSAYYKEASQREDYVRQKKEIIAGWLSQLQINSALDAGANEGEFSLLLSKHGIRTVSADFDHYSINKLYEKIKQRGIEHLYPVLLDLSNPSAAIGVNNQERASFVERSGFDLVLALALIHHLAIGKNIDFEKIASLFLSFGKMLIIEFVPKEDPKMVMMLQQKADIYGWYTKENFIKCFSRFYTIRAEQNIGASGRTLYLMQENR